MELQAEQQTRKRAIKALEQHIIEAPKQRAGLLLKEEQLPEYMARQHELLKILRAKGLRI